MTVFGILAGLTGVATLIQVQYLSDLVLSCQVVGNTLPMLLGLGLVSSLCHGSQEPILCSREKKRGTGAND